MFKLITIKQKVFYNKSINQTIIDLNCIQVFLLPIAIYFVIITLGVYKTNISSSENNLVAFVTQVLISSMFVKIHVFKKQKETLFLCFCLKLFIDCQCISLKCLLDNFVCNQNAHIMKIFSYALGYIVSISKVTCGELHNIRVLIFGIV